MKSRMTIEEIQEFKPTFFKPMKLIGDKEGETYFHGRTIYLLSAPKKDSATIDIYDKHGNYCRMHATSLKNYPSLKPEEPKFKEVVMYQPIYHCPRRGVRGTTGALFGTGFEALEENVQMYGPNTTIIGYKPVTVYLKEEKHEE